MGELQRPTLSSALAYRDPRAALAWLEIAFGFEPVMVVVADDGSIAHSEMRLGDGLVMVGGEWDDAHRSPASLGGVNSQSIHVQLAEGIDAHCQRARAAGAVIVRELADQFYGDRIYAAADPEGHVWSFGQTNRAVSREEMARTGSVRIADRL